MRMVRLLTRRCLPLAMNRREKWLAGSPGWGRQQLGGPVGSPQRQNFVAGTIALARRATKIAPVGPMAAAGP